MRATLLPLLTQVVSALSSSTLSFGCATPLCIHEDVKNTQYFFKTDEPQTIAFAHGEEYTTLEIGVDPYREATYYLEVCSDHECRIMGANTTKSALKGSLNPYYQYHSMVAYETPHPAHLTNVTVTPLHGTLAWFARVEHHDMVRIDTIFVEGIKYPITATHIHGAYWNRRFAYHYFASTVGACLLALFFTMHLRCPSRMCAYAALGLFAAAACNKMYQMIATVSKAADFSSVVVSVVVVTACVEGIPMLLTFLYLRSLHHYRALGVSLLTVTACAALLVGGGYYLGVLMLVLAAATRATGR